MKTFKNIIKILLLFFVTVSLNGCSDLLNKLSDIFKEKEYTIIYDTDGGNIISDTVFKTGDNITLPIPTKEGYEFIGWYEGENKIETINEFRNYQLKAHWGKIYTITYDLDDGICDDLIDSFKVVDEVILHIPTKEGYEFLGWYENGNKIETINELRNYQLKAKWEEIYIIDVNTNQEYEFRFDDTNQTVTVIKYKGNNTNLKVPYYVIKDNVKYKVTSIGDDAFYDCSSLISIEISDSVTSIGNYAFDGCSSLTSVIIPDSVTSIGNDAFDDCSSLTSITIPDSVTSIGNWAFEDCSSLTKVNITDIAAWCNIEFRSNPLYYAHNLYLNDELVTDLVIPDGVTSIGSRAFEYCSSLTSIIIPDSVTSIGNYTFRDCSSLTSITIPSSVTSIGYEAFKDCSFLTNITIGSSVTSIGEGAFKDCPSLIKVNITDIVGWCNIKFEDFDSNPLYYAHNLYLNNELVTDLVIPEDVTSIGDGAFKHCSSLKSVTIPNSVTSIGGFAFAGSSIKSITIGSGVTSIGNLAFYRCSSLTKVNITDIAGWCNIKFEDYDSNPLCYAHNLYLNNELVTDLVIPNSVTSIGGFAFAGSSIKSITIGSSVTSIGNWAFEDCSSLTKVNITDIAAWCNIEFRGYDSNPLYYAHNLYLNDKLVTGLVIPDGVTSIGHYAFEDCSSLTSITIPNSVTSIGGFAFAGCSSLTSITIPDSVTSIGNHAFKGCSSLTINCEVKEKPAGWSNNWNPDNRPVNWGFVK